MRELKFQMNYTEEQASEEYSRIVTQFSNGHIVIKTYDRPIKRLKKGFEPQEIVSNFDKIQSVEVVKKTDDKEKKLRHDNLARSRNTIIEYACENEKHWKSFITLTIAENVTDITLAYKYFQTWIRLVKFKHANLMYLCVPEFQKRGAIHFHLITNIECGSSIIPKRDTKKLFNPGTKKTTLIDFYDIKYWNKGFSSAFDLTSTDDKFNVALYVTKYLYKDIDDRFYGRNKILKSNNLKKPNKEYLNVNSISYNDALEYISKKGYPITIFTPKIVNEYQIPSNTITSDIEDIADFELFKLVGDYVI